MAGTSTVSAMQGQARSPVAPIASIAGAVGYSRGHETRPIDLRLEANECAFAPPDLLGRVSAADLGRYANARDLERRLGALWGLGPEHVIVTAGADEALHRLCIVTLEAGRRAILPDPTFEMLDRYVRNSGAERVAVAWVEGEFPLGAFVEEARKGCHAAFVVSPNNPTGLAASFEDVRAVREAAPRAAVVLDAAYGEFGDDDPTARTLALPGTIVTRTFSKAWGLAGLRVGYAMGDPAVIGWMRSTCEPYPVAGPSLAAVDRWLDEGAGTVSRIVAEVRRERADLASHLRALGARPTPSQANFVFCGFDDAAWAADALASLGIAVRRFDDRPGLTDRLRITCPGDARLFERLARALSASLRPARGVLDRALGGVGEEARRGLSRRGAVSAADGPTRGEPGWFITARPEAIAEARSAGMVPIVIGATPGDPRLIAMGASRVIREPGDAAALGIVRRDADST